MMGCWILSTKRLNKRTLFFLLSTSTMVCGNASHNLPSGFGLPTMGFLRLLNGVRTKMTQRLRVFDRQCFSMVQHWCVFAENWMKKLLMVASTTKRNGAFLRDWKLFVLKMRNIAVCLLLRLQDMQAMVLSCTMKQRQMITHNFPTKVFFF